MKNVFLKSTLLAIASVGLMVGSALAIPLTEEYELINPDPITGKPNYEVGKELGYYIWTDNEARTDWHIRWSGDGPNTIFSGYIILEGNEFDTFYKFKFENHANSLADWSFNTDEAATYFAIANIGEDGLDFTITNLSSPSYVGFDLFMNMDQKIGENIFFGADNITAASLGSDGDFKVAAPVPEPATMLLFGTGLVGLAGVARRKKK